ncbi:MAG: transporter suffix domain-containing protein [Desulfobacterales bacterium]
MTAGIITETELKQMRWRLRLGIIIFVIGFLSPLLIPLVTDSELPTKWKAVISGFLAVGIPELFSIAAIAIMGKSGFNYIKERFFGFFKKYGPADRVSRTRYRIGLVMFLLPFFFGWLAPYIPIIIPGYDLQGLTVNLIGDVMFISSLFVLGGEFWDKVRALFVYGATAKFPESAST